MPAFSYTIGNEVIIPLKVDGNEGKVKQGLVRDTDGTFTLVVWLEKESISDVHIEML